MIGLVAIYLIRLQFTVASGAISRLAKITCGVPQGSVLSPLLFLLYVNDIANSVPDQNIKLFADDTNLFISTTNQSLLNSIVNEAICLLLIHGSLQIDSVSI